MTNYHSPAMLDAAKKQRREDTKFVIFASIKFLAAMIFMALSLYVLAICLFVM